MNSCTVGDSQASANPLFAVHQDLLSRFWNCLEICLTSFDKRNKGITHKIPDARPPTYGPQYDRPAMNRLLAATTMHKTTFPNLFWPFTFQFLNSICSLHSPETKNRINETQPFKYYQTLAIVRKKSVYTIKTKQGFSRGKQC